MTNHMEEVAKLLGVELEEEFRIEGTYVDYIYKISEKGLFLRCSGRDWWEEVPDTLVQMLAGRTRKIIKLPQKPNIGATYYYPSPMFPCLWKWRSWKNDEVDNYRFQHGFVFTTPEEAIALAQRMMEIVKESVKANG